MKATAIAPANIALIKYWGKKDEKLRLPANGSVSINLSNLNTTTTVEFSPLFEKDKILINKKTKSEEAIRVIEHLDRIRKLAGIDFKAKVVSQNNFPSASGLASSASGFAALTLAASSAAGLKLSEKELSILARQGSGSACRSIPDGFVEWLDGDSSETSYAISIFPPDFWDIRIVAVVVDSGRKEVSSTEGHKMATTSLFYPIRLKKIKNKIIKIKELIREKNFIQFGELIEEEALELHAVIMTSTPSIIYWAPTTLMVMKLVWQLRKEGLPVYFTIDAGPHLHLFCEKTNLQKLVKNLKRLKGIKEIIVNKPTYGARLLK